MESRTGKQKLEDLVLNFAKLNVGTDDENDTIVQKRKLKWLKVLEKIEIDSLKSLEVLTEDETDWNDFMAQIKDIMLKRWLKKWKNDKDVQASRKRSKEEFTVEGESEIKKSRVTEAKLHTNIAPSFKALANAEIIDDCLVAQNLHIFPYPPEKIEKLMIRKCYSDIFDLFVDAVKNGETYFGISGTPGIGKSLFFIYLLYRCITDEARDAFKPKTIVYQKEFDFLVFDLENWSIRQMNSFDISLPYQMTLYIIDGGKSIPRSSWCTTIFISSPRSDYYKSFIKHQCAREWFFPIWSKDELDLCRRKCYPELKESLFEARYKIYGGVARYVLSIKETTFGDKMKQALRNVDAVRGVKSIGNPTSIFSESHTLMHMIVGDISNGDISIPYQFLYVDVASTYVGEQLWLMHGKQMLENVGDLYGKSPSQISWHLYEIYGHLLFRNGKVALNCKNLKNGEILKFPLSHCDNHQQFGRNDIPSEMRPNTYYETSDDINFPAIDSFSDQGMFQFTVSNTHPIRGIVLLKKICNLFQNPKLYFVVPHERFKDFKIQPFKQKKGNQDVKETIENLEQFVLEMNINVPELEMNISEPLVSEMDLKKSATIRI